MNATAVRDIPGASLRGQVSDEEWQVRIDLAAAYRLAHLHGWTTTLIYNHISARIPGPDHHFLLNPFGLRWDEVTASNLVKIVFVEVVFDHNGASSLAGAVNIDGRAGHLGGSDPETQTWESGIELTISGCTFFRINSVKYFS